MPDLFGSVNDNEEVSHLQTKFAKLKLEGLQSSTYLCLLRNGPLSANQISQKIRMNRTDTYRVLRTLTSRGLVNTIVQTPNLYEAARPELAIRTLIGEMEEQVQQARRETPDLIIALNSIKSAEGQTQEKKESSSIFKLLKGKQVIAGWKDLLKAANREIIRLWSPEGIRTNYSQGIIDDYRECSSRGIRIRAITEINKRNMFESEEFSSVLELRHMDDLSDVVRYEIADESEILISSMNFKNDAMKLEGIRTNNMVLISGFKKDFESLWRRAYPAKTRLDELRKKISIK